MNERALVEPGGTRAPLWTRRGKLRAAPLDYNEPSTQVIRQLRSLRCGVLTVFAVMPSGVPVYARFE
eukprot:3806774-Alexandrium_andersonii.AAC.1